MNATLPRTTAAIDELYDQIVEQCAGIAVVRRNEPLAKKTTLRVGGPADIYLEPASEEALAIVLRLCDTHSTPWMLLGRGSNLLVRDGGIRGVVISLVHPDFAYIRAEGSHLRCGAGARLREVAMQAKRVGLSGLEFLEGIPGSVGGALRMNAGAMGSAMFERVESVRYMTRMGEVIEARASQIPVDYRSCPMLRDNIALGAVLRGEPAPREQIESKLRECSEKRWKSQPAAPSAGCIFKNSPSIPTGRLVEELGLKGTRRGGAVISDVHGNFLVNEGNATAKDILSLIDFVKAAAKAERGIELHTEVQIVGED